MFKVIEAMGSSLVLYALKLCTKYAVIDKLLLLSRYGIGMYRHIRKTADAYMKSDCSVNLLVYFALLFLQYKLHLFYTAYIMQFINLRVDK